MGDPHSSTSSSTASSFKGKLVGHYVWPFTMHFPNRIVAKGRDIHDFKLAKEERLPPNLRGFNDLPLIDYQLSVSLKRAHLLRLNSLYVLTRAYCLIVCAHKEFLNLFADLVRR